MELFFDSSQALLDSLYENYKSNSKSLIRKIDQDKKAISRFDTFNKRLKISWGMKIEFTDDLRITSKDTRACYELMLKLSDLWFAFEHLGKIACEVIPRDAASPNIMDPYRESTLEALGFHDITSNFNQLLYEHVLHKAACRREVYLFLTYLADKITNKAAIRMISDTTSLIKDKRELQARHVFALAYSIRNIYAHEGVAAALGSRSYQVKRTLYSVLYDTMILYSLALGHSYCRKKAAILLT